MSPLPAPELSTAALIASCLESGSETAWREFIARFQPLIASVIVRMIRRYGRSDPSLADDLVQDTFLRLCKDNARSLRNFEERHDAAIFGFLKVVAASVTNDHFRNLNARKRLSDKLTEPEDRIDFEKPTLPVAEQTIILQEVDQCIGRATDNKRDQAIFWLYYRQGLTAKDIAQLPGMGLTAKGIESCIFRLTRVVRQELAVRHPQNKPRNKGERPPSTLGGMR